MPDLASILRQEVNGQGILSFRRFMELALYCPVFGYYERNGGIVGSRGDFVTSVSHGSLYGRFLASQFIDWCADFSGSVQWVEAGAHDGSLAADILSDAQRTSPAMFDRLEYVILEPSERRRIWQASNLHRFLPKVRWCQSPLELQPDAIKGIIFSNELLDAFPVHRLHWDADRKRWLEWGVVCSGERFDWQLMAEDAKDWSQGLREAGFDIPPELAAVLPDGFILELSPDAGRWWHRVGRSLKQGRLLTIDYGSEAVEFLTPARRAGTLRAYRRHTVGTDLLAMPGGQDLTAHVNFTQLIRAGEAAGLQTAPLVSQAEFLAAISRRMWTEASPPSPAEVRQFHSLTHPEHMGRSFRVLVQSRHV